MPIRPENRGRYPADWKLRSRFVRVVRSRGRCESGVFLGKPCQAVNGKPHPITGSKVVLTAAHVYDHRPESAGLLNLAALCQRCHLAHDMPQRTARRVARWAAEDRRRYEWRKRRDAREARVALLEAGQLSLPMGA